MEEVRESNRTTVIQSLIFKFSERFAVKIIGLVISIILARLLEPELFGFLAILNVFISFSSSFVQGGLNTALIQNKSVDNVDYSTVYFISLALAIILIILIIIVAPFIAEYYDNEQLTFPLRVYSFSLLVGAFNSVQIAKAAREMRFKQMMICSLISTIISGIAGVSLSFLGFGLWALVFYSMFQELLYSIILFRFIKWFPVFSFSRPRAKELFGYGWKMLISSILCNIYGDIRSLIIGKKFSTTDLAYYNRGDQFPASVSLALNSAIQSVMLPVLSKYQDSQERLHHTLKQSVSLSSALILPAMFGLSAVSSSFVIVLLGEKWIGCIVYFQLLCFAHATVPYSSSNLIVIQATGRSDVYMILEVIRRIVMFLIMVISVLCFKTIVAIAVGYVISSWVDVVIIIIAEKKYIGYSLKNQIQDTWHAIFASIIMSIVVYLISFFHFDSCVLLLIIQVLVGVFLYGGLMVLFKDRNILYMWSMLSVLFGKIKHSKN